MAQDFQLRFSDSQALANGDSENIVQPTIKADAGKAGSQLVIEAAISGQTGTATADMTITLSHGTLADGSDMKAAVQWTIPAARVTRGGTIMANHIPAGLLPFQKLTYAGIAGVTGGVITAGYAIHGGETIMNGEGGPA